MRECFSAMQQVVRKFYTPFLSGREESVTFCPVVMEQLSTILHKFQCCVHWEKKIYGAYFDKFRQINDTFIVFQWIAQYFVLIQLTFV